MPRTNSNIPTAIMTNSSPTPDNSTREQNPRFNFVTFVKRWFADCVLVLLIGLILLTIFCVDAEGPKSWFGELMAYWLGLDSKKEMLSYLGLAAGGVIVLMSTLALRSRAESQNKIAEAQKETAEAQMQTAKAQKQTAEASFEANQQTIFESGITNLGSESESVRLGGIYTLYELAAKESDRTQNIVEILCAHLRAKTQEGQYKIDHTVQPSNEIASLLFLLSGEKSEALKDQAEYRLDFSGAFLNGANFMKAQLQGAYLIKTQMQGASFIEADLQGADITEGDLQGTRLWDAHLQKAHLRKAQLQGAILWGAQLQEAELWRAQLQGSDLSKANLQGADLSEAQLQEANLTGANLQGANLTGANLQGANLTGANLQGANLTGANLQGANLTGANLQGADLTGANLQGTDLTGANLQGAKLPDA